MSLQRFTWNSPLFPKHSDAAISPVRKAHIGSPTQKQIAQPAAAFGHFDAIADPTNPLTTTKTIAQGNAHQLFSHKQKLERAQAAQAFQEKKTGNFGTVFNGLKAFLSGNWGKQKAVNDAVNTRLEHQGKNIAENAKGIQFVRAAQQEQAEKIQKQRMDFEENKQAKTKVMAQHQAHLKQNDARLDQNEGTQNAHKSQLQKHRQEIEKLDSLLHKTNNQVSEHGVEIGKQANAIHNTGVDIQKFAAETDEKFRVNDEKLTDINAHVANVNARNDQHHAALKKHDNSLNEFGQNLQEETDVRKQIRAKYQQQLSKHGNTLADHEDRLRKHGGQNVALHENIGALAGDVAEHKQHVADKQQQTDATLANHQEQIATVTDHANTLQSKANVQAENLAEAKARLAEQQAQLGNAHTQIGEQKEAIDEQGQELAGNAHKLEEVHSTLHAHAQHIDTAHNENRALKGKIGALGNDVQTKHAERTSELEATNKNVKANKENIATNAENLRVHSTRIKEARVRLDEYGNVITVHDENFVQHGGRIEKFENRFRKQNVVMEKFGTTQAHIDDTIMEVETAMVKQLAASKANMEKMAEIVVQNMHETLLKINAKEDAIHELQQTQRKLFKRNHD